MFKNIKGKKYVFDDVRKKFVRLTPEEWVRQHCIQYLTQQGYSLGLMLVEKEIKVFTKHKRVDILVHDSLGQAIILVECKAPEIKISQTVVDQAARYNIGLKVPYLMVTNGLKHLCCSIDHEKESYKFITEIPLCEKLVL